MIAIIDYDMGNVGSIKNMFARINAESVITADPEVLAKAKKLVLPGVGHFDEGMRNLNKRGLAEVLNELVIQKEVPILGICLGMQLFTSRSEEGIEEGLGWIDAEVRKFSLNQGDRIPHMGWNRVYMKKKSNCIHIIPEDNRFYFVHSYCVTCNHSDDVLMQTQYGGMFTSAVEHNNILGVQFHPEKSHSFGMALLREWFNGSWCRGEARDRKHEAGSR